MSYNDNLVKEIKRINGRVKDEKVLDDVCANYRYLSRLKRIQKRELRKARNTKRVAVKKFKRQLDDSANKILIRAALSTMAQTNLHKLRKIPKGHIEDIANARARLMNALKFTECLIGECVLTIAFNNGVNMADFIPTLFTSETARKVLEMAQNHKLITLVEHRP
jgi:hypothetical protein